MPIEWAVPYLLATNAVAWALTVWDKRQARRGGRRISEVTLLLVAALGGSPMMYVTMQRIRHKTRHRKFMWGLPLMLLLQFSAVLWSLHADLL